MTLNSKLVVLAGAVSLTLVCGAAWAAPGGTERGAALVRRNCTQCHTLSRTGPSPDRTAPPLPLLSRYVKMSDLALALRQGLLMRHPAMPQLRFNQAELEEVMSYLAAIQERVETSATLNR